MVGPRGREFAIDPPLAMWYDRPMTERRPGEIFTAYKVTANVDKNEGRFGGFEIVGVFFTQEQARVGAQGQDVMGTDARVKPIQAVMGEDGHAYSCEHVVQSISDEEIREKRQRSDAKAKKRALAKLTDVDKRVLGL